jgi:hypothetical protein
VIDYDCHGNVWVAPGNTFEMAMQPEQNNDDACELAVPGRPHAMMCEAGGGGSVGEADRAGRRSHSVVMLVAIALALLVFVPACSSTTNRAADPPRAASSTKATSTTSPVTVPEQNPAELATCAADSRALAEALDAAMVEKGVYPSPPAPWSAATYVSNYQPLTAASGGGPFLQSAPGTKYYVIEYDAAGHIWIAPPGVYGPYNVGQDLIVNPDICEAAVG